MRTPDYLSPTSIDLFKKDQTEFYLKYLSDNRPPKIPQNEPMAVGSAFDAYAKSYLHSALFGENHNPKYSFEALFEAQVEPHLRDWAREPGKHCFDQYKSAGALADLMTELRSASNTPRFEFEAKGAVEGYREPVTRKLGSVVLMGKPDCHFINGQGAHVILDWKVSGYCSDFPPSPMQGYVRMRSAGKFNHGMHKSCQLMTHHGMQINIGSHLDYVQKAWAAQLSIYAWLMGEPIGGDFVVAIDQIVCNAKKSVPPEIRIAEHRMTVSKKFQENLFIDAVDLWELVHSDWIFRDMSREESQRRCEALDGVKAAMTEGGDNAAWLASVCRESF